MPPFPTSIDPLASIGPSSWRHELWSDLWSETPDQARPSRTTRRHKERHNTAKHRLTRLPALTLQAGGHRFDPGTLHTLGSGRSAPLLASRGKPGFPPWAPSPCCRASREETRGTPQAVASRGRTCRPRRRTPGLTTARNLRGQVLHSDKAPPDAMAWLLVPTSNRIHPPFARNALELMGATILEADPGAGHQVFDRARNQYLSWLREGRDAGARMNCDCY